MHNTVRWKICLTDTLRRFYVDPAVFFELLPWGNPCLEAILSLRQSLPWGNPSLEVILALRQSLPGGNFCLEAILALRQSLHGGKPCMEAILALRQSLPWGKTCLETKLAHWNNKACEAIFFHEVIRLQTTTTKTWLFLQIALKMATGNNQGQDILQQFKVTVSRNFQHFFKIKNSTWAAYK